MSPSTRRKANSESSDGSPEPALDAAEETVTELEAPAPATPEPNLKGVVVIENNGYSDVFLPSTKSHAKGKRLIPGLNNVPRLYLHELMTHRVKNRDNDGEPGGYRYPGQEALKRLQTPVRISQMEHADYLGPRITIYEPDQLRARGIEVGDYGVDAEGPPPPASLAAGGYNFETAARIIRITKDPEALKRWAAERGVKQDIKDECLKRLGQIAPAPRA